MSTNYHTPIATGAAANASVVNAPLSTIDSALTTTNSTVTAHQSELVTARSGYASLDARLDSMAVLGSNVSTNANGAANAGQKNITVDSTVGFLVGAPIAYELVGGVIETNTIASITPTTLLVCENNIGSGGIADNEFIVVITPGALMATGAVGGSTATQQRFTKGVFLGGNTPSADDSAALIGRAASNPLATLGSHAVRDESTYNPATAGGYASFDSIPIMTGTNTIHNHLLSFQARPNYSGAGLLQGLWGFTFKPTVSGPVENCYGVYILNPIYDGGDVDGLLAGVYIEPLSGGDLGSYGIFVASNQSYFGGGVLAGGVTSYSAFTAAISTVEAEARGLSVVNPSVSGAGAVSLVYGVYISPLSRGTSGNYAIYVEGANPTYLGGSLQVAGAFHHVGSTAGFFNTSPTTKPTITGSRGSNAALASLIGNLANLGLCVDGTTA